MKNSNIIDSVVHFNVRSSCSIGDSICQIPRLVRKAREMALPALACVDVNMFGAKEFHDACLSMRAYDYGHLPTVKPIIGLAVRIRERGVDAPLVLLAKNKDGYHNLVRIVSENSVHGKSGELVVPLDSVQKRSNGVICLAGGGTEYLMLSEEMFAMLPRHPEWVENTRHLAIEVEKYDLNEMLARCSRRCGKLVRIGLVVVDNLQLVTISGKASKDRPGQEQEILYRLVRLAFERFCQVVVLPRMPRFSHRATNVV